MKKTLVLIAIGFTIAIVSTGIKLLKAGDKTAISTEIAVQTVSNERIGTEEKLQEQRAATTLLTGLKTENPINNRPIMFMINNHPSARPQSGLSNADIIYEFLAEGEITRLLAIFQSEKVNGSIGPVRSIRPYFIDIAKSYDAIPVHAGGSPDAYNILSEQDNSSLDEITNAGSYFWREGFRKAPHNLYTSISKIEEAIKKKGYRENNKFSDASVYKYLPEQSLASGEPAINIDITFLIKEYKVTYQYDSQLSLYRRLINGKPHVDLNNNEQITTSNVVVLGTEHKVMDSEGRLDVKLIGKGPALLFQQGVVKRVEWSRDKENNAIRLLDNNIELLFEAGKIHFLVVPLKPTFESHVTYS